MDTTHDDYCDCGRTAVECQEAREALARQGIFT